jgi:hypothetical protein
MLMPVEFPYRRAGIPAISLAISDADMPMTLPDQQSDRPGSLLLLGLIFNLTNRLGGQCVV